MNRDGGNVPNDGWRFRRDRFVDEPRDGIQYRREVSVGFEPQASLEVGGDLGESRGPDDPGGTADRVGGVDAVVRAGAERGQVLADFREEQVPLNS